MDDLFLALFLLTIPVLIVGLIKPAWLKMPNRKVVSLGLGGAMVVFFALFINLSDDTNTPSTVANEDGAKAVENTAPADSTTTGMSKEDAEKELDEFMALSKKAGLVTSYEFSESASVVYVGEIWYSQTAVQKKDFIAYVGKLKKAITGYQNFKLKDAYSDEVVAELTAFSGDLKVYK